MSSKTNIGYSMRGSESYRKRARERGGSIVALGQYHHSLICGPFDPALTITLDLSLRCQDKSHDNCRMIEQGRSNTTSIPIGYDSHRLSLRRVELTEFMRKLHGDSSSISSQQGELMDSKDRISELSGTQDASGQIQSKVADVRRKLETEPTLDDWEEGCLSGDENENEEWR